MHGCCSEHIFICVVVVVVVVVVWYVRMYVAMYVRSNHDTSIPYLIIIP